MKVTTKETTSTTAYVEIGGKEFDAYTVREVLEGLADTDPYFKRMLINDSALEAALDVEGVIWKSVRGSVSKGKGYKAFVKEFEAATGYEIDQN